MPGGLNPMPGNYVLSGLQAINARISAAAAAAGRALEDIQLVAVKETFRPKIFELRSLVASEPSERVTSRKPSRRSTT